MSILTTTKAYLAWIIIGVISWIISWFTGELHNLMGQAVDLVYDPSSGLSRDQRVLSFIIISLVYWIVSIVISGLLVFFTNKRKAWAKYLLTAFCMYQIYYEISGHLTIADTYNYSFGIQELFLGALSLTAVVIMGILPHLKRKSGTS